MAGVFAFLAFVVFSTEGASATTFTLTNSCRYTVWPGLLSSAGTASLSTTGFALQSGESRSLDVPAAWSGRFWGRTHCSTDSTGKFTCGSGDCGSGSLECSDPAAPPATLAEFTLAGSGGMDFYDVSLVDGYNLPMLVVPEGGSGGTCTSTGCLVDLNPLCPSDLKVVLANSDGSSESVGCKSACEAFGSAEYCCNGEYGNPNTCRPSSYSQFFKNACPRAYSYAYDDATSTFTCLAGSANYLITFCPSTASQKSSDSNPQAVGVSATTNTSTMVYVGGNQASDGAAALAVSRAAAVMLAVLLSVIS